MQDIPRDAFVPDHLSEFAHGVAPLPIGEGQAISRSYIVALMTQLLGLSGKGRVLVTAAVLCELCGPGRPGIRMSRSRIRSVMHYRR
jgi:protein-L-isoaspartate(D-aspartate) O-methyltransferase